MKTQERINLMDIKDYIYMRQKNMPTNVKWRQVRSLHMPNGQTFWQMFLSLDGFDENSEPSMSHVLEIGQQLGIC